MVNKRKLTKFDPIKTVAYLSLFFIGTGFYLYQAILALLLDAIIYSVVRRKNYSCGILALLFLFAICNSLFLSVSITSSGIVHQFAILFVFYSALQLGSGECPEIELVGSIYALGSGLLFHLVLAIYNNFITGYIFVSPSLINPVTNEPLAATHYSTMLYFALAIVFAWFTCGYDKKLWQRLFIILTLFCAAICVFMLARRLVLIDIFLLLLCYLLFRFKSGYINVKHVIIIIVTALVALVGITLFFDKIISMIGNSYLMSRFKYGNADVFNSGRLNHVKLFLAHFFEHITGGRYLGEKYGYAHNLWLDIYDETGLLPFLLMIIISLGTIFTLARGTKNQVFNQNEAVITEMVFIVSFLQFFSEPAYQAEINFVWAFMFIAGIISARTKSYVRLTLSH